jgi:rod shape-determining protein MreB
MLNSIIKHFTNDIAIDLGTSSMVICTKKDGVLLNEPAVVAFKKGQINKSGVLAVGKEAQLMMGKTPKAIETIRPMRDGVIADFKATEIMIQFLIERVYRRRRLIKPRIIICLPREVTQVERNAVKEAALRAGAREVFLVDEPMAAAIGAGLEVSRPAGHMVVDIGAGTTEVGVTSLAGLVLCKATRVAGDKIDKVILDFVRQKYNLHIGIRTAESIKVEIGSAFPPSESLRTTIKGRDNFGYLVRLELSDEEVRQAIKEPLSQMAMTIKNVLEVMPAELASDIVDNGIVLTGGGALIRGLDKYLSDTLQLPVHVANEPLLGVARGLSELLCDEELLQKVYGREKSHILPKHIRL